MLNTVFSAALGLLIALAFIAAYIEGLRLGMRSAKGAEPPSLNPVRAVEEDVRRRKEEKRQQEIIDEWEAFERFDGFTDEERAQLALMRRDDA